MVVQTLLRPGDRRWSELKSTEPDGWALPCNLLRFTSNGYGGSLPTVSVVIADYLDQPRPQAVLLASSKSAHRTDAAVGR
jgi:hypothetical protein